MYEAAGVSPGRDSFDREVNWGESYHRWEADAELKNRMPEKLEEIRVRYEDCQACRQLDEDAETVKKKGTRRNERCDTRLRSPLEDSDAS